ncbi:MAG TPA: protein-glutamate O-methyltransferase CheR [Gemmataceae bacterium]|jgi:chemotaxis protein methyltransferase CheR|nr:protein-glutamate O-methyltransferase CheR [Gemmataceae bacterium]
MTPTDFEYVCRLVRDRSGIVLEAGKEYLVDSRLTPVARQHDLASVSDLVARLRAEPDGRLATQVLEAMVTSETMFFRDLVPFETLRTTVLPDLVRRRRGERRLSVWFAACSTGQEPYSFALLVREYFPELTGWRLDLLATDLSADVLGRARAGRYNQIEVNRGLPAAMMVKYFRQHGATWELSEDVRRMVEFRELNLIRPWPTLPRADLVFLRNVMIYFDVEAKKSILGRVAKLLRPDGYVLLGAAETTFNLDASFRRVDQLKGGFYQLVG